MNTTINKFIHLVSETENKNNNINNYNNNNNNNNNNNKNSLFNFNQTFSIQNFNNDPFLKFM